MKLIKSNNIIRYLLCLMMLFIKSLVFSQGRNSVFFMGYHDAPTSNEARMTFTNISYSLTLEQRDIPFEFTQGNISDENGNILMSSNGVFIANSTGDTMSNGSGLNPSQIVDDWKDFGLPMPYANIILTMPDDSNKYVLFYHNAD